MKRIVGVCLSQFHGDDDNFELLVAYSDGMEIGNVVSKQTVKSIAQEFYVQTGDYDRDEGFLSTLREIAGNGDGTGRNPQLMVDAALAAIARAEGRS